VARYDKEHKQATRQRIIDTAGRRFKRDGIDGSGIATLMADAGLTRGGFYSYFDSKSDLSPPSSPTSQTSGRQLHQPVARPCRT
jgi:hypothetical protein